MRRPARLAAIAAILLLVLAAGGYTAFWLTAASRIKAGLAQWAEEAREQKIDAAWQGLRVTGYPFAFRVEAADFRLRDTGIGPPVEVAAPTLAASAKSWDFRDWEIELPRGISGGFGKSETPLARIAADSADGAVSVAEAGEAKIWLTLRQAGIAADLAGGSGLSAREALVWVILPATPPQQYDDRSLAFAADLRGLKLPLAPPPFGNTIDDLAFGMTLLGPIGSGGSLRQAAQAWSQAGGTLELDHVRLLWDGLNVTGSGSFALDNELQPIAALSGAVEGYDRLFAALVAAGQMRESDARLARLALSFLAKTGFDGRPQIATSFSIQNGEMFLGPAKLGPAPRIAWE